VVFIGKKPYRSLSFKKAEINDSVVKSAVNQMLGYKSVLALPAPLESEDFIAWTKNVLEKIELEPQVKSSNPVSHLYTMKQMLGEQEIYFFVNSDRKKDYEFEVTLDTGDKFPYIWIPQTGERFAFPYKEKNKLNIKLDVLESALIVYEPEEIDVPQYVFSPTLTKPNELNTSWDVKFDHVNGTSFTRKMEQLIDFKNSEDEAINTFAGAVTYTTHVEHPGNIRYIKLSNVNEAVSELTLNGKPVGMKWYGNHCYDVENYLRSGSNEIKIKITTMLANYCRSLSDNPTAQAWTRNYKEPFSSGLTGVEIGE
jgi:hypothetical protein